MIEFVQHYNTLIELILIFISGAIAVFALIFSITTSRRQNKIALFKERYEVVGLFRKIYNKLDIINSETLTTKGKICLWNVYLFDTDQESKKLGRMINSINEELEELERNTDEYNEKINLRNEYLSDKFKIDIININEESLVLEKGCVLFSKDIVNMITRLDDIYRTSLFIFENPNSNEIYSFIGLDEIFEKIDEFIIDVNNAHIIEKMEKYVSYTKLK